MRRSLFESNDMLDPRSAPQKRRRLTLMRPEIWLKGARAGRNVDILRMRKNNSQLPVISTIKRMRACSFWPALCLSEGGKPLRAGLMYDVAAHRCRAWR
jgi:hypothetical protein